MLKSYRSKFIVFFAASLLLVSIPLLYIVLPFFYANASDFYTFSFIVSGGYIEYLLLFFLIVSYLCYLVSCYWLVKGKGLNGFYSFGGLFPPLGLVLLFFLPGKKLTPMVQNKNVRAGRILFFIGVCLNSIPPVLTLIAGGIGFIVTVDNIGDFIGIVVTLWVICSFITGALFLLTGIVRVLYEKAKKIKKQDVWEKAPFVAAGIVYLIVTLVTFFILNIFFSFITPRDEPLQLPALPTVSPSPGIYPMPTAAPGEGRDQSSGQGLPM